ncbi:MAG TPA: hypothetical protein VJ892_02930 [Candidatus Absconditabacterales bacterium]|nr:hypothetical protein [Candidatus Absconditabacterales bacterium]
MKKYFIVFLFLSLFFVGCSKNEKINLDFQQTNSLFVKEIKEINNSLNLLGFSGLKNIEIYLDIFGENQDFKLNSALDISGSINYQQKKSLSSLSLDSYFWDKSEQQESLISGKISNISIENDSYFKIKNPNINIGRGNFQGDLINIISDNIKDKWIKVEKQNNFFVHNTYNNIRNTLNILSSSGTFQKLETLTYENNLAYKVTFSPQSLNTLNQNNHYKIKDFEGLFIINSNSEIILKIQKMLVSLKDKEYNIKGFIGPKDSEIKIQEKKQAEKIKKVNFSFNKKNIEVSFSSLLNIKEMFNIYLKLYPKTKNNRQEIQINSIFSVSPILIYGSDLEKNIQIDINGQYLFQEIDKTNIKKPESYVLGQQILGDSFSLQTIMNDK